MSSEHPTVRIPNVDSITMVAAERAGLDPTTALQTMTLDEVLEMARDVEAEPPETGITPSLTCPKR